MSILADVDAVVFWAKHEDPEACDRLRAFFGMLHPLLEEAHRGIEFNGDSKAILASLLRHLEQGQTA